MLGGARIFLQGGKDDGQLLCGPIYEKFKLFKKQFLPIVFMALRMLA